MKDGGPAFPCTIYAEPSPYRTGMSLRDYFAAAALSGYCAQPSHAISWDEAEIAAEAYATADAMIAERDRRANPNMAPGAPDV